MICPSSSWMRYENDPCSTPGLPSVSVAACFCPGPMPSPAASTPISFTSSSSTNSWNRPMALDPPPTHATRMSGFPPHFSIACARVSRPMHAWKSRTIMGYGCGPATEPRM